MAVGQWEVLYGAKRQHDCHYVNDDLRGQREPVLWPDLVPHHLFEPCVEHEYVKSECYHCSDEQELEGRYQRVLLKYYLGTSTTHAEAELLE